jgi:hypothetical protein
MRRRTEAMPGSMEIKKRTVDENFLGCSNGSSRGIGLTNASSGKAQHVIEFKVGLC